MWINSSCVASKFPRHAEAPLSEYSPIEADSAEVLALHDGSFEPKLRRPDRRDLAAGSRADDNDVKFHSVCVIDLATSCALRPRARALKVRALTRSSRSMMSLRLSRGMPCVMKIIRDR